MKEKRILNTSVKLNTRSTENTDDLYISGYFVVFNSIYEIWEGATESVSPTAFEDTLNNDIRCLINHDSRLVLGRTTTGTLKLEVDEKGLWGEVKINKDDTEAMNLYARVKRGDVSQCSFGFDILKESTEDKGNNIHWTIEKAKLYEVSIVTFPAYKETNVTARQKDLKEFQKRKIQEWKQKSLKRLKRG